MRPGFLIPAAVATLALAGCGIVDPYTTQHRQPGVVSIASTATTGTSSTDDPSDRPAGNYPPGQLSTGPTGTTASQPAKGAATPEAALAAYAALDTNWTAQTLGSTQRKLAAMSVGQARATALQAAASYSRDTILQHSQVRNTGTIVTIAPARNQPGVWVVVTQEQTTGQGDYAGLPAQPHVIYARVIHTANTYLVSRWSARS